MWDKGKQPLEWRGQGAAGDLGAEGGRRRRRRRRRGRGDRGPNDFGNDRTSQPRLAGIDAPPRQAGGGQGELNAIQPTAIISVDGDTAIDASRDPLAPAPRAIVRDRQQIMAGGVPSGIDVPLGEGEELAGKELADATIMVMTAFDRNAGPVPIRAIAEQLARRGRLTGDPQSSQTQLSASLRADNLRRLVGGTAPALPLRQRAARRADRLGPRAGPRAARARGRRRHRALPRGLAPHDAPPPPGAPGARLPRARAPRARAHRDGAAQGRSPRRVPRRRGALLGGPPHGDRRDSDGDRHPQRRPRDRPRAGEPTSAVRFTTMARRTRAGW